MAIPRIRVAMIRPIRDLLDHSTTLCPRTTTEATMEAWVRVSTARLPHQWCLGCTSTLLSPIFGATLQASGLLLSRNDGLTTDDQRTRGDDETTIEIEGSIIGFRSWKRMTGVEIEEKKKGTNRPIGRTDTNKNKWSH